MDIQTFTPDLSPVGPFQGPHIVFSIPIKCGRNLHEEGYPVIVGASRDLWGEQTPASWKKNATLIPEAACGFQLVEMYRYLSCQDGLVSVPAEIQRSPRYFPGGKLFETDEEVLEQFDQPYPMLNVLRIKWRLGGRIIESRHGHLYNASDSIVLPIDFDISSIIAITTKLEEVHPSS